MARAESVPILFESGAKINVENIVSGISRTAHIKKSSNANRNVCFLTTALHMFVNSPHIMKALFNQFDRKWNSSTRKNTYKINRAPCKYIVID